MASAAPGKVSPRAAPGASHRLHALFLLALLGVAAVCWRSPVIAPAAVAASAVSAASCPSACLELQRRVGPSATVTCDVANYDFDWGNRVCQGILPLCVLRPSGAADVAVAVRLSREVSLPISYRSGGHSYTCNSIKHGSLHVDLRSLDSVALVPSRAGENHTEIEFGTGNNMRMLIDALGPGQTIVHGQCPTVGAGGLFLHGGRAELGARPRAPPRARACVWSAHSSCRHRATPRQAAKQPRARTLTPHRRSRLPRRTGTTRR